MTPEALQQDIARLREENRELRHREKAAIAYVRQKIDQLLGVMGTLPLKPEELDDETLIGLDPIGIVSDSFAQVLEHLKETNQELALARDELQAIFDSAGAAILVVDARRRIQSFNRKSQTLFFPDRDDVLGLRCGEIICGCGKVQKPAQCIFEEVLAAQTTAENTDFASGARHFHVIGTPVRDQNGRLSQVILVYADITERMQAEISLREAEERLKTIVDAVQTGIVLIDAEHHVIVDANDLALKISGHTRESLIGASCRQTICFKEGGCPITDLKQTVDHRECLLIHSDGREVPILKTVTAVTIHGRQHLLESFIDISERKKTELALQESEERYRSLYRTMREGVALHELIRDGHDRAIDYRILDVNPSFEAVMGLSRSEVVGRRASDVYGADPPPCLDIYTQVAESGNSVSFEMTHGPEKRVFSISVASPARDKFATIFDDITLRKQAEEEIHRLAFYDVLTHLPNRILLRDRLGQALAQTARAGQMLAVLFIDIDRFKGINDTMGHATGDLLLKIVADRLVSCVRKSDTVARVGGDEFVIIQTAVGSQPDITVTAEKILHILSTPVDLAGREIYSTGSLGIAIYPGDGQDVDSLLKNADMAMYRAKELGRNTFQFFTPEMDAQVLDRQLLCNDLRRALQRGEMFLHYQPQFDLAGGRVVGMEALLRWSHPEFGIISPAKFIPLAEEIGIIFSLGRWVLETACRQIKAWHRAGFDWLKMAVNLSGQQFKQHDLYTMIRQILAENELDPAFLELELTESTIMENSELNKQLLNELKNLGVLLTIDDFGTGYSALGYLKQFPIDRVKIDRCFVHDIIENPDAATIAEAIISLAHSLKMKVVAEGVETREQMEFLRERGCDEIQGYFFCRPTFEDHLTKILHAGLQKDFRLDAGVPAPKG